MTGQLLFFDAGPIISLVMSRLTFILSPLKQQFGGKFCITPAVHRELVERPLQIKRFEFEALEVMKLLAEGVLEVYPQVPQPAMQKFKLLANSTFHVKNKAMDVVQSGELESVTAALETDAVGVVMDERTLRLFIENGPELQKLLELRFREKVQADREKMQRFSSPFRGLSIIRSVELVAVAYQLGLLDSYVPSQKNGKKLLLDAVLWATKYNGCAVTDKEIKEMEGMLLR